MFANLSHHGREGGEERGNSSGGDYSQDKVISWLARSSRNKSVHFGRITFHTFKDNQLLYMDIALMFV